MLGNNASGHRGDNNAGERPHQQEQDRASACAGRRKQAPSGQPPSEVYQDQTDHSERRHPDSAVHKRERQGRTAVDQRDREPRRRHETLRDAASALGREGDGAGCRRRSIDCVSARLKQVTFGANLLGVSAYGLEVDGTGEHDVAGGPEPLCGSREHLINLSCLDPGPLKACPHRRERALEACSNRAPAGVFRQSDGDEGEHREP